METPQATRPTVVTVLGVLFIIGASFGVLASFGLILVGTILSVARPPLPPAGEAPPFAMQMFTMMRYGWALGLFWLALSGLQLAAAIAFLRLRAWGRTVLEVLIWWGVVFSTAYTIWWSTSFGQTGAWVTGHSGTNGPPQALFPAFSIMTAVMSLVLNFAIAGVFIYLLRSRPVREAMQP